MPLIDVNELATALNLTPQRVQQLVKLGLPRRARGQYELGPAMHWYIRYLQAAIEARSKAETGTNTSLATARTLQAQAKTQQLRAANMKARGEVVLLSALRPQLATALKHAKRAIGSLPKRVKTDRETRAAIKEQVDGVIVRLAARLTEIGNERPVGNGRAN